MRFAIALALGIGLMFSAPLYAAAASHEVEEKEAPEVSARAPAEGEVAPAEGEAPVDGEKKAEEAEPDPK